MQYQVLPWEFDQLPKWVRRDILNRFRIKSQEQVDQSVKDKMAQNHADAKRRLTGKSKRAR